MWQEFTINVFPGNFAPQQFTRQTRKQRIIFENEVHPQETFQELKQADASSDTRRCHVGGLANRKKRWLGCSAPLLLVSWARLSTGVLMEARASQQVVRLDHSITSRS